MNKFEYTSNEILKLQMATQITSALISRGERFTVEEVGDIALSITEYLLEKCLEGGLPTKTPPDRRIRVPEGDSIIFDSIDITFYYEYTNQEGNKIRKKLGE